MNEIVLATSNRGKLTELQALLPQMHCISQQELGVEDAEETGLSFVENALIKARHASCITGKAALADDSGLVVPALNGAPGIYSARYAGQAGNSEANIIKLLDAMQDLPTDQRQAYFYCAIAIVRYPDDPTPLLATGACHGLINTTPAGAGGFGYDPVFFVPEYACTMAQLTATIKNQISHRAKALEILRQQLTHGS